MKRGQISTEYLIVVSFIVFVVLGILAVSFVYTSKIRDTIKFSQIERMSDRIISSAETIFYAGEPSKTKMTIYIPEGIQEIEITSNEIIFTIITSSGQNVISYNSNVPLEGSLSSAKGTKVISLEAQEDRVIISE